MSILPALLAAFVAAAHAVTVDEVLAHVDKNLTYEARESDVTMTVVKSGRTKVYKMHSYGRGQDESAIEYLAPEREKGSKLLKKKNELWTWWSDVEKVQKLSGHLLRQGVVGSDMSYEDLMESSSWHDKYTGTITGEPEVDGHKTWAIELKAKDTTVAYPKRLIWVDESNYIPVKQELYALSGMLLKTWEMADVRTIEGRQFPMKMVVVDKVQKGSRTEITFDKVTFKVALPDEVFSTRWLER